MSVIFGRIPRGYLFPSAARPSGVALRDPTEGGGHRVAAIFQKTEGARARSVGIDAVVFVRDPRASKSERRGEGAVEGGEEGSIY